MIALFFLCATYVHQKQFDGPTAVSRLDLLHALWGHGVLHIDQYHHNTSDKAVFDGRYYSDKAPGTVVLALLPFGLAATMLSLAGMDLDSKTGWLVSSWVGCAGSIAVISVLGSTALFSWLSRFVPPQRALITTLGLFLGAAPLPYSTMMFSHALVVGLLAIAMWAMNLIGDRKSEIGDRDKPPDAGSQMPVVGVVRLPPWRRGLAGFCLGLALASEYSAGIVVTGLVAYVVGREWRTRKSGESRVSEIGSGDLEGSAGASPYRKRSRLSSLASRPLLCFFLAAVPPLLLIPAYSWACFGDPFTLPYSHQASFPAMKEGLYAIQWPDADTAFNLLFSPARGLFFWTPFLLLAGFGYWRLAQRTPGLFWLTYAVPLLHIVVISGRTWDWQGGPAWGPRLLSPILPLLALPCALGVQKLPWLGIPLAVYSIAVTTLATLTDACPPVSMYNPLIELNLPLFLKGEFSPNLGMLLGLPPYASVALYYAILIGGIAWLWRCLPKDKNVTPAGGVAEDVREC